MGKGVKLILEAKNEGFTMTTKRQILRVIDTHCKECYFPEDSDKYKQCENTQCRLNPILKRNGISKRKVPGLIKTIRQHCWDCCCGSSDSIRLCAGQESCALWPYRMGVGPEPR
ncbi:hypothetical protein Mzhil_1428 [Methanosalsum zhilinae DSM 4017]|uniref:Uncharacterized protein n=1 Tax=Methanosalsum zhilinae (strain DSM 4017 / NBRC 107636 / OCM 62 / WeN5) TaxID=679901 RepID=F7XNS1_METZD|nr:hypothetical protein Mzhil_1428 [Methanosalsum zhilinae DSM 4017]